MELKYFKTRIWGDCYVPENDFMNTISITKKHLCLMAFDDSNLEGLYKPLQVKKEEYEELKESAIQEDRQKATGLLKKIHKENEKILNSGMLNVKEITDPMFNGYYNEMNEAYENKKPILE